MTNSQPQEKNQLGSSQGGKRRTRLTNQRKTRHWSTRRINGSSHQSPVCWNSSEVLKPWKQSERGNCRFYYGFGNGQVLLEREEEQEIWKVMTVPGFRFSPTWLEAILKWAQEYQQQVLNSRNQIQDNIAAPKLKKSENNNEMMNSPVDNSLLDKGNSSKNLNKKKKFVVNLSLRCERMGLTDMELEMIAKWHKENSSVLSIVKLWLFDNKITDVGAPHLAQLIYNDPLLLEIHISHNSLTNRGAEQIINALSISRKASCKPFWLRMEWNTINHNELKQFIQELKTEKGVIVDIPRFHLKRSKGRVSSCLINEQKIAHLRLPWIQCQRLRPSEAPVLMQAKASWQEAKASTNQTPQSSSSSSSPSSKDCEDNITEEKPKQQNLNAVKNKHSSKRKNNKGCQKHTSDGPLLIFPDTSALLGLIGCKMKSGSNPYLSFDWLESLCQKGKFGTCIPSNERIFFVLCDSVMKQLDGLKKHNANVGLCVRKLVNSGLEKYGPAGQDFLTILGAHEGEGIIVDRNAELLDSRSHHVFNKGQAIDLKIVEVALFFQQELCQARQGQTTNDSNSHNNNNNNNNNSNNNKTKNSQMTSMKLPNPNNPSSFPVVLFSNDNVQLTAAKSHGLPAFRYTDLQKFNRSKDVMQARKQLTASILRNQIGKKATSGLGECAQKSLQYEFDGIVACMKHLMESYEGAKSLIGQTKEILEGNIQDKLKALKELLDIDQESDHRQELEVTSASNHNGNGVHDHRDISAISQESPKLRSSSSSSTSPQDNRGNGIDSESSLSIEPITSDEFKDLSLFGLCLENTTTSAPKATTTTTSTSTSTTMMMASTNHAVVRNSMDSEDIRTTDNSHHVITPTMATTSTTLSSNEISEGSSDDETIPLVRAKLLEWECLVKSYQHPSRILRWTSGQLYPE